MNTWQKITVGTLAAIVWGVALYVAFIYPTLAAPMAEVKMVAQNVLAGIGLYHLLITPSPTADTPPDSATPSAAP